jgi:hypothetical protein
MELSCSEIVAFFGKCEVPKFGNIEVNFLGERATLAAD